MSENETKAYPRIRIILDHPYLAIVLSALLFYIPAFLLTEGLYFLMPEFTERFRPDIILDIAIAIACLFLFKRLFKGQYTGNLSWRHFGLGMLLLIPMLFFVAMNFSSIDYSNLTVESVVLCLFDAVAVGIQEETAFRALSGANFMRVRPDGHRLVLFVTISGLFFGLCHMGNIATVGAAFDETLMQVISASGLGVLLAAVYFRTGSLIPGIVFHVLVDFPSFLVGETTEYVPEPVTPESFIVECVLGLIIAGIGYWYLRRSKREKMKAVWAEKWPAVFAEDSAQEEIPPA